MKTLHPRWNGLSVAIVIVFVVVLILHPSQAAAAQLSVSPSSFSFGNISIGKSASINGSVTNTTGGYVTISAASVSGTNFKLSNLRLPVTLSPRQSKTFTLTFTPTAAGTQSTSVSFSGTTLSRNNRWSYRSSSTKFSASAPVTGSGVSSTTTTPGQLSASPTTLSFGSVQTGSTKTMSGALTNSGGSSLTITQASISGTGFSLSGLSLPLTLSPSQSSGFTVTFAPQSGTSSSGSVSIATNISSSPITVALSGTGVTPGAVSASPSSLTFGTVQVGSSTQQSETLTNTGGSAVTISQASITGAAFTISGLSLPVTLSPGQVSTFGISFTPTASGASSGSVVLATNASVANLTIALSGTGSVPSQLGLSPSTLTFGSVNVGSTQSLTATLTASGSNVSVSSATTTSSEFTISGLTLPATITAGQSKTFTVIFTPQSSGTASGSISFASNTSGTAPVLNVSGTGAAVVQHSVDLSWSPSTSSVSGYNVYRGSTSGGPYTKINSSLEPATLYTDSGVQSGNTYFYVTTAVGTSGTESSYSNQVQAAIP